MLQQVKTWRLHGILAVGALGFSMLLAGCMNVPAKLQEAARAADSGNWALAQEITEKCLKKERNNVTALVLQGLALHMQGRTEEATIPLEQASLLAENNFAAQYLCGWVLSEAQRYGDALTPLRKAYSIRPDHQNLLVLLSRCCLEQNLPDGMEYLVKLQQLPGQDIRPELNNAMGVLCVNQGRFGPASVYFNKAWKNDPESAVVPQNLGVLYDRYMNSPLGALRYYNAAYAKYQSLDALRAARVNERVSQLKAELAKLPPPPTATPTNTKTAPGDKSSKPSTKPGTKQPLTPPGKKATTTTPKSTSKASSGTKSTTSTVKSTTAKKAPTTKS